MSTLKTFVIEYFYGEYDDYTDVLLTIKAKDREEVYDKIRRALMKSAKTLRASRGPKAKLDPRELVLHWSKAVSSNPHNEGWLRVSKIKAILKEPSVALVLRESDMDIVVTDLKDWVSSHLATI